MKRIIIPLVSLTLFLILATGCGPKVTPSPTATPTAAIPTPTEEPMALKVNGEGITMVEYQAELTRLQQADSAQGNSDTADQQRDRVIQNYTEELLLEQAATQGGYTVDDATLQSHIDALTTKMGGTDKLQAWESANGYTEDTFRASLKRSIAVAWERDQIIDSVPTTADEVHARQVLVQDKANADSYYEQIKNGADFATLAYELDPTTGGDLGWFPKGYLTQVDVENAAFSLEAGQFSEVIHTELGYHILYVIERDANHTLSVDARKVLQQNKLDEWLKSAEAAAKVEVLVQ